MELSIAIKIARSTETAREYKGNIDVNTVLLAEMCCHLEEINKYIDGISEEDDDDEYDQYEY